MAEDASVARVMIADRDPALAETWRAALENEGHVVTVKTSGLDALQSIRREPPDVLIADLLTPAMGGLALAGKAKLTNQDIKTIVVTDSEALLDPRVDGLAVARRTGADLAIARPLPLRTLIESVRALLANTSEGEPSQ